MREDETRKPPRCSRLFEIAFVLERFDHVASGEKIGREEAGRFIVHGDEKLTAFLGLERAVCIHLLTEPIFIELVTVKDRVGFGEM